MLAAAEILRIGYSHDSLVELFKKGIKIICDLDDLGLLRHAAGYLVNRNRNELHLSFQYNMEWVKLLQSLTPPDDICAIDMEKKGDEIRYCFPLYTEEDGLVGIAKFFARSDRPLDDKKILQIRHLLSDLAVVIAKRWVDNVNSQLAELAGASPNEMYLIDAETLTIFQANKAVQIKTGYRPDQILGKSPAYFKEGITEEDYRKMLEPLLDGRQQSLTFEGIQRRRDGTHYEASYRIWKLESDDGVILNEIVEDESGHKQVFRLLQATFNSFPGGICVLDPNLTLTFANDKLYELLQIREAAFPIGCNYEDLLRHFAKRGDYGEGDPEEQVRERVSHARLFIEHSFERDCPDGTTLEISASPLAGGGSVVTYMDVTARRRVEKEIRRHRDALEEAVRERTAELREKSLLLEEALEHERQVNQLQRQFVSMASHEFRTPLTVIDGAAQRLARRSNKCDAGFIEDKSKQIRNAVDRIVGLMESILSAGKLENGSIAINPVDCPVSTIIRECCDRQMELSSSHKINLTFEDMPDTIRADRLALDQIFTNLLSNAVKYSPNAPQIEVRGWRDGENVKFSVRDNGLGIDEDDIPLMFERYFRARTSTGIAGTGIGLNLIKQVIELHDGSIELQSKLGAGSTFTVTLPIAGPAATSGVEDAA